MEVVNNKLEGVIFKQSPNQSGSIVPKLITIHYTAASTAQSAINWMLNSSSKVSAHLHIARNGEIVQLVEFHNRAFHAGKSSWKGLSDLNWHSIGIELQNLGNEEYTDIQLTALVKVCRALINAYPTITEIVGHSDIAPGRKIDPGKQFPMEWLRDKVFNENLQESVSSKTTITDLNLRGGSGTNYSVIEVLEKGTEVDVLWQGDGWAEVYVEKYDIRGWVSDKYIK